MKRTQLNLDEKTYYQLVSYARAENTSLSQAARELISKQINKQSSKKGNPFLALAELGEKIGAKGGPSDLGENHDYYLYVEPYLTEAEKKHTKKQ